MFFFWFSKEQNYLKLVSLALIFFFLIQEAGFSSLGTPPPPEKLSLDPFVEVADLFLPGRKESDLLSALQNPRQKLVIYFEEAHGNLSALRNIAEGIRVLSETAKIKEPWIALEGTRAGPIDHRTLSQFPDAAARRLVTEFLLHRGDLDGAEYYAALYNSKARLFGVDSGALAQKNREAYQAFLPYQSEAQGGLRTLRKAAGLLKKRIYDRELLKLDRSEAEFEQNPSLLSKHLAALKSLSEEKGISFRPYPALTQFMELKALEAKLPSDGFARDKRAQELLQSLKGSELFKEIEEFRERLWNKLIFFREARDAHSLDQIVQFYEKLFNFALLPEDYLDYLKDPSRYSLDRLEKKIRLYHFLLPRSLRPRPADFLSLETLSGFPFDFYRTAHERNPVLMNHLTDLMSQNPQGKTFFIAGGFHRQELARSFRKHRIPYVVLSPRMNGNEGQAHYWKRLEDEAPSFEGLSAEAMPEAQPALSSVKLSSRFVDRKFDNWLLGILSQTARTGDIPNDQLFKPSLSPTRSELRTKETPRVKITEKVSLKKLGQFLAEQIFATLQENQIELDKDLLTYFFDYVYQGHFNSGHKPDQNFRAKWVPKGISLNIVFDAYPEFYSTAIEKNHIRVKIDLNTLKYFQNQKGLMEVYLAFLYNLLFFGNLTPGDQEGEQAHTDPGRAYPEKERRLVEYSTLTGNLLRRVEEENPNARDYFIQSLESAVQSVPEAHPLRQLYDKLKEEIESSKTEVPSSSGVGEPPLDLAEGTILENRFVIKEPIGKGGFGRVYLAYDKTMKTDVAVKELIIEDKGVKVKIRERLDRETRMSSKLQYSESSKFFGYMTYHFNFGGKIYQVFRYVPGKKLSEWLPNSGEPFDYHWHLTKEQSILVMLEVLQAVSGIHKLRIVHRDLKPANVMLEIENTGDPKVTIIDFGLAKELEVEDMITSTGVIMGTPDFMSPEQARGESQVTPAQDIFSSGLMFFNMLSGFNAVRKTSREKITSDEAINRLQENRLFGIDYAREHLFELPNLDEKLLNIIQQSRDPMPDKRYSTADDFLKAIQGYIEKAYSSPQVRPSQSTLPQSIAGFNKLKEMAEGLRRARDSKRAETVSQPSTKPAISEAALSARRHKPNRGSPGWKIWVGTAATIFIVGITALLFFLRPSEKPKPPPSTSTSPTTAPRKIETPTIIKKPTPPPVVSSEPPKPEVTPEPLPEEKGTEIKLEPKVGPDPVILDQAKGILKNIEEALDKLPSDLKAFERELTELFTVLDQPQKDFLKAHETLLSSYKSLIKDLKAFEAHLQRREAQRGDPPKTLADRLKDHGTRIPQEWEKLMQSQTPIKASLQEKIAFLKNTLETLREKRTLLTELEQNNPDLTQNPDFAKKKGEIQKRTDPAELLQDALKAKEDPLASISTYFPEQQLNLDLVTAQLTLQWFEVLWLTHRSGIERDAKEGSEPAKIALKSIPNEIETFKLALEELKKKEGDNKVQAETGNFRKTVSRILDAAGRSSNIVVEEANWATDSDFKNLKGATFLLDSVTSNQSTFEITETNILGGTRKKNKNVMTARKGGGRFHTLHLPVTIAGAEMTDFRFSATIRLRTSSPASVGQLGLIITQDKPDGVSEEWSVWFVGSAKVIQFNFEKKKEKEFVPVTVEIPFVPQIEKPIVISMVSEKGTISVFLREEGVADDQFFHTFKQGPGDGKLTFKISIDSNLQSPNPSEIHSLSLEGKTFLFHNRIFGSPQSDSNTGRVNPLSPEASQKSPRSEVRKIMAKMEKWDRVKHSPFAPTTPGSGYGIIVIPFGGEGRRLFRRLFNPDSSLKDLLKAQRVKVLFLARDEEELAQAKKLGHLPSIYGVGILKFGTSLLQSDGQAGELETLKGRAAASLGIPEDQIYRFVFLGEEDLKGLKKLTPAGLAKASVIPMEVDRGRFLDDSPYRDKNMKAAAWLAWLPKHENTFRNFPFDRLFQFNPGGSIALIEQELEAGRLQEQSA